MAALSIISDFAGKRNLIHFLTIVLILPVIKITHLKITRRQKFALVGLFAVGTIVAVFEIVRIICVLDTNEAGAGVDTTLQFLFWNTMQCTVGIVATNLPILRPLFFTRSFGSSNAGTYNTDTARNGTNNGLPWVKRTRDGSIPLDDLLVYGNHATVSAGETRQSQEHVLESGAVLKSVEVRIETESAPSSIHSNARQDNTLFDG
jgi:hypothetical protein